MKITKIDTKEIKRSIPITNFSGILGYICDDFNRSIKLSKKLKEELTTIFGKQNTTLRLEFFNYVWVVEFNGNIFNIFTSNKGTSFEIVANYGDDKAKVCLEFLKEMEKLIDTL